MSKGISVWNGTTLSKVGSVTTVAIPVYCGSTCKCTLSESTPLCLGSNAFNSTAFTTCTGTVTGIKVYCGSTCKCTVDNSTAICLGSNAFNSTAFTTCTGTVTGIKVYCGTTCKCTVDNSTSICLGSNAFNSTAFTTCTGTVSSISLNGSAFTISGGVATLSSFKPSTAGTADNSTCFGGCTYACAKADIRNYTPGLATCSANTYIGCTSTNANYPLVFKNSAANVTAGYFSLATDSANSLYYNPVTNTLYAHTICAGVAVCAYTFVSAYTGVSITNCVCCAKTPADYAVQIGQAYAACCATAIGFAACATGACSTAMGYGAYAPGTASNAIGFCACTTGVCSTAIGYDAHATGAYSTAIGFCAQTTCNGPTAIGFYACATGACSTAMGYCAHACNHYSIAIGCGATSGTCCDITYAQIAMTGHHGMLHITVPRCTAQCNITRGLGLIFRDIINRGQCATTLGSQVTSASLLVSYWSDGGTCGPGSGLAYTCAERIYLRCYACSSWTIATMANCAFARAFAWDWGINCTSAWACGLQGLLVY